MMYDKRPALSFLLLPFLMVASFFTANGQAQSIPGLTANQLVLPTQNQEIKWYWLGDTVNNQWELHAAMIIPVTLPSCPKQFYMQFDLGAASSIFYSQPLEQIKAKYPKAFAQQDALAQLKNLHFQVDGMKLQAKELAVVSQTFPPRPIDWTDKNSRIIIGTLGADLIDNKVVAIDYVNTRLYIGDTFPAGLHSPSAWSGFHFARRSVLLPATINGKNTLLYFDTGSSAYTLLTDKATCQSLAGTDSNWQTYPVASWNKMLTAHTTSTTASVEIAAHVLPLKHATYIEGASNQQIEHMMKLGIGGMTGNKLFLNSMLVLDTKSKKFGIVMKGEK